MSKPMAAIELAKFAATAGAVFTKKLREVPAKCGKLTRVPFAVSRLMEFCTKRELTNQTGHHEYDWPLVIAKEMIDNGLDACEEAGIAPVITIDVRGEKFIISDNGPGIPASVIDGVMDYSVRTSSREAYVSPTRGAQGNALKTILPMGYVLDEARGENASAVTLIEAHGIAHRIKFSVDHIKQEPRIGRTTRPSLVEGTRVTVRLPPDRYGRGFFAQNMRRLIELAESYTWINPRLSLRLTWDGELKLDHTATNPSWKKWLPSWPTSAHWYDIPRFRRYAAAHIAHDGKITVREFILEFDGMTSTIKQKAVLAETGSSHMRLHKYFGVRKPNAENIAKLLAAIKAHTKPVKPQDIGIIGRDHLFARMAAAGGAPKTFKYLCQPGETNGVPRLIEVAFGVHREAFSAGEGPKRKEINGVNWSPGLNNPFRQLGHSGQTLDGLLATLRADMSRPVITVIHVACPRVDYTDRGKSAIVVENDE
jgi:DNA topoisomerase VI subunit B